MKRRNLIGILSAYIAMQSTSSHASTHKKAWNKASVGPWTFLLPEDWHYKSQESGIPYFESFDGSKGAYIKSLRFNKKPILSEKEIIYLIHEAHEKGFNKDQSWFVKNKQILHKNGHVKGVFDALNKTKEYRILSISLACNDIASQLTLHDYLCSDYDSSSDYFSPIANSLEKASGV